MIKWFLIIVIIFPSLFAGSYAGDFMEIGAGVKALSIGGAFSSIADDGTAIYWNPAGISQLKRPEISAMRAFLYKNLATYDNITYCQPLPNQVTLGISWTRLTISDIPVFEEKHLVGTTVDQRSTFPELHLSGIPDDEFSSKDDLLQIAFSKHVQRNLNIGWLFFDIPFDFYFGGSVKYIKRDVYQNMGTGAGFDLSMLTKTDLAVILDLDWLGTFNCGVNFQNIGGTTIVWDTESKHEDEILLNTKLGLSLNQPISIWKSVLTLAYDHDYVYEGRDRFGFEWMYNRTIALRLGLCEKDFSTGIDLNLYGFQIDYAFITNVLGHTNRVGISYRF
ncbi:MAG: hypothetical protein PHR06_10415 [Candidatus Cloacimonetes bacterium]|nr:hypothetical protein [Candidatus Cloacimonadota bacterium]